MLLCRFRTSWRFSKLLCKYGGAVNVGTVKKNYKINRANAPKCHFFMEEVHHHIKDITSLHQTWTSEEIEKWWDIWCGCKWAQWEFGSYFGANRCFFLCVLSYLQDCNYWFFTFCLKKNQIFLTTTWVFGVRFGTVHLAQMSFDPDCVKCTYRAAVLLLHASVPGILSARVHVCRCARLIESMVWGWMQMCRCGCRDAASSLLFWKPFEGGMTLSRGQCLLRVLQCDKGSHWHAFLN